MKTVKPKIYVTRRIPQPGLDLLATAFEVEVNSHDRVATREELIAGVQGKDALLCLLTDKIDAAVMDAAGPGLRVIANYAVGFDNVDVPAATLRGIPVTNTPGVLTDTTADLAFALLMATARRVVEADRFMRAGMYRGWGPMLFLGQDIHHKTLGIVGLGRIGRAMAERAAGFHMRILYTNTTATRAEASTNDTGPSKAIEKKLNAEFRELPDLLRESDFVSLHVPLTESTHHLISDAAFDLMKRTAILINTSRGPVVDEKALVRALKMGKIAGAGLDVYEREPECEPELRELDNVVMVPHIASASVETRTKMATMAAENAVAAIRGEVPPNLVNPEVWDRKR
ncbi:MAG: D-glycerate dehydrogenase [Firmicutes bacterium]|jgi:glyoxylate reductase|nr:D-glycerate dehydrogenase [Bacillota bacterium]MDH7494764.1 D-glycerate dehydrogenase [Bacillota bacterium]